MNEQAASSDVFRAHPKCLLTELADGTGVVLNLNTRFYFTLNHTAVVIWKALEQRTMTAGALAGELSSVFDVRVEDAERDAGVMIEELLAEGLIERV